MRFKNFTYALTKEDFNSSKDVMDLSEAFDNQSILEVVGVERKEIRHSRFIKWFFNDPRINTGTKHAPFNHLMDVLVKRDLEQHSAPTISDKLREAVLNRSVKFLGIKADIEVETKGFKLDEIKGSIDIVINCTAIYTTLNKKGELVEERCPVSLTIENKIDSPEHDHQVWRYYYYMTGKTPTTQEFNVQTTEKYECPKKQDEEQIFVFLSPLDICKLNKDVWHDSTDKCECSEHYIHISYQDLVNNVFTPVVEYGATPMQVLNNIEQYISSLGIVVADKKDNDDKSKSQDYTVMAVSKNIALLSNRIWANYKGLIERAVCNSEPFALSYKNFFNKLLNAVAKTTTDYNEWKKVVAIKLKLMSPNYNIVDIKDLKTGKVETCIYNQSVLPAEFVKKYLEYNPTVTLNELQQIFMQVSETLFFATCQNSRQNGATTIEVKNRIWIKKNIWNATKNDGYWSKMLTFIDDYNKQEKDFKFKII